MAAYELLYRSHGPGLLHRVIRPRVPTQADADDVLATTFASALQNLPRYSDRGTPFGAWLARIAINACFDLGRRATRDERRLAALGSASRTPIPTADTLLGRAADRERARREVEAVLADLNPRYALALRLRLLDGCERDECAAQLQVSTATFDVVFLRATRSFRERWTARFGEAPP